MNIIEKLKVKLSNSSFFLTILILFIGTSLYSVPVTIINPNGTANAEIICCDNSDRIVEAANELRDLILRATGVNLDIRTDQAGDKAIQFHIGKTTYVQSAGVDFTVLKADGFWVAFRSGGTRILLVGDCEDGSFNAVLDFLESKVGVKWLMPGTIGEYIPQGALYPLKDDGSLVIETGAGSYYKNPTYISRMLSGFAKKVKVGTEWVDTSLHTDFQNRHRLASEQHTISFHHNMINIFKPSLYAVNYPHYYCINNGDYYFNQNPISDLDYHWQPRLTLFSGTKEHAITVICNQFNGNPNQMSYSLGINDSINFSDNVWNTAYNGYNATYNVYGYQDFSYLYYTWCNQVVNDLVTIHGFGNKTFGCLAYFGVSEAPPGFRIHKNIYPYLTYERAKWADSENKQTYQNVHESWANDGLSTDSEAGLGIYDYLYGSPYLVPRTSFSLLKESLSWAASHRAIAYYAETCPNFANGPKIYILAKLLWNPYLNLDSLLNEWYEACGGGSVSDPNSAAYNLREYYKIWDDFWTYYVKDTKWFYNETVWFDFGKPQYLEAVTEDMVLNSRNYLEMALNATVPDSKEYMRVNKLLQGFEYFEQSIMAYQGQKWAYLKYHNGEINSDVVAAALLEDIKKWAEADAERLEIYDTLQQDTILVHPLQIDNYGSLLEYVNRYGKKYAIFTLKDYAQAGNLTYDLLNDLKSNYSFEPYYLRMFAQLVLKYGAGDSTKNINASFEAGSWGTWISHTGPDIGSITLDNDPNIAVSGSWGMRMEAHPTSEDSFNSGGVYQDINWSSYAKFGAMFHVKMVNKDLESESEARICIQHYNSNNELQDEVYDVLNDIPTDWHVVATYKPGITYNSGDYVRIVANVRNLKPGEVVAVDDCMVYTIE